MPNRRKPNIVHKLQGTYTPSRHDPKPSLHTPKAPAKPDSLSPEASKVWDERVEVLTEAGFLTLTDGHALAQYCELWAEFVENPRKLAGVRLGILSRLMGELGMTPASRDKIAVQKQETGNPFAEF